MLSVCHVVNVKLGSLTFKALQNNGDKNIVLGLSGKMVTGSMKF